MDTINGMTLEKSIEESMKQTFEAMAFIDVEVDEATEREFTAGQLMHILFSEPIDGEMVLILSKDCKMKIIENIYGEDWTEVDPTAVDDCLLEMLNVIAGNFLNFYCGYRSKHNLSLPNLIFDLQETHDQKDARLFHFDAEGAPLKVSLRIS
jgi:CheY-specific phosphatase CheX